MLTPSKPLIPVRHTRGTPPCSSTLPRSPSKRVYPRSARRMLTLESHARRHDPRCEQGETRSSYAAGQGPTTPGFPPRESRPVYDCGYLRQPRASRCDRSYPTCFEDNHTNTETISTHTTFYCPQETIVVEFRPSEIGTYRIIRQRQGPLLRNEQHEEVYGEIAICAAQPIHRRSTWRDRSDRSTRTGPRCSGGRWLNRNE